jgi:penicillin-binding protein 2
MRPIHRLTIGLLAVMLLLSGSLQAAPSAQILGPRSPEDTLRAFMDAWQQRDYPGMYSLLSAQSRAEYGQPVFETVYSEAMTSLNPEQIAYTIHSSRIQGQAAMVTYDVTFTSSNFGTINDTDRIMRMVSGANGWGIAWTSMDIMNGFATGSRLEIDSRSPQRGNIYDRDGSLLVEENGSMIALYSTRLSMPDQEQCIDLIARLTGQRRVDVAEYFASFALDTYFFLGQIEPEKDATDGALLDQFCDVGSSGRFAWEGRRYVGQGAAVHVTGYVSFIPRELVQSYVERGYGQGDLVGLGGVEEAYQDQLAGRPDQVLRIVSPADVIIRELAGREGEDPTSVTLTLDRDLQVAAGQAMVDAYNYAGGNWAAPEHSPGAGLVVLDVNSGAVLAMVSYPYYDPMVYNPNTFAVGVNANPNLLAEIQADPRNPRSNRVTQEQYFPGSTFKIVTTAAAIAENRIPPSQTFFCDLEWDGSQSYGDTASPRSDWRILEPPDSRFYDTPAGDVTAAQALSTSCNPFFYEMGARLYNLRPAALTDYARRMGFGSLTGIGVLPEAPGSLPDTTSVEAGINEAIGQGGVQVTLLQMARMVAAVANGGTLYQPYVVQAVGGQDGTEETFTAQPVVVAENMLPDQALATVREGMCGVVNNGDLGTAFGVFYPNGFDGDFAAPYSACGKTGTAQSGRQEPYGWFVVYAPADNPQIAIAAMVEYSREGSETAAPIVRRVLDAYFNVAPEQIAPYPLWWFENGYNPLDIPEGTTLG